MKIESYAVVVSYNPENDFINVISSLSNQPVDVIVIDNGSKTNTGLLSEIMEDPSSNINLVRLERNIGLANAQNVGIKTIMEKESNWDKYIFFFDQDTIVPHDYISKMTSAYKEYEEKNENDKLGILAPNYKDKNIGDYAHYVKLTEKSYIDKTFHSDKFLDVSIVISSGSMVKIDLIKDIGFFMGGYYIDQIDVEYCLRVLENGYSIIATSVAMLTHTIGDRKKKKLLFLTLKPNFHSAFRKYYIFRNGIITLKQYKNKYPGLKKLMVKRFIHDLLGVIFFEDFKIEKFFSIYKGVRDGIKTEYSEYK